MAYILTLDGETIGTYKDAKIALTIAEIVRRDEEVTGRRRDIRIVEAETPTAPAQP